MPIFQRCFAPVFILGLFVSTAKPQVNTESLLRSSRSGLSMQAVLGFGFNAGNSEFFRWRVASRLDYQADLLYAFAVGNLEQGTANEQVFLNRGFVHLRTIFNLDTLFRPEVFVQREFNEFILLKERTLDSVLLFIPSEPETKLLRSTNYLAMLWRITPSTSLQLVGYFQVDVARWSDYRILLDGALTVGITNTLSLSLVLHYRYDNEPVPTVKPFDLDLRNEITFSF